MKYIIELPEEVYKRTIFYKEFYDLSDCVTTIKALENGTPLEEISNPCIECSQNCCVCELNREKCDCQKVYVVKENKNEQTKND